MRQGSINAKGAIFQVSDTKWVAKICLGVDENGKSDRGVGLRKLFYIHDRDDSQAS